MRAGRRAGRTAGLTAPLTGLAVTTLALAQLLVPSAIGLADNGDYYRLTCLLGVAADVPEAAPRLWTYWVPSFRPVPATAECVPLMTSQTPLLRLVQALSPGAGLDLRVVGALHACLLGLLVAGIVRGLPARVRLVGGVLLGLVLLDTGRLVYLSSAYSEPVSLLGLLLLLAGVLAIWRRPPQVASGVLVGLLALPLVLSKPQNAPLALAVAGALVLRCLGARAGRRRTAVAALAGGALLGVAGLSVQAVPEDLVRPNSYNIVFYEVLAFSADPERDAAELGLPPALARYRGTQYFQEPNARSDPAFAGFYDRVGPREIVLFYVRHPSRAMELYARAARASFDVLPDYLGTYDLGSGRAEYAQACRGCPVTWAADRLTGLAPVLLPALWLGAVVVAVALRRRPGAHADDRALGETVLLLVVIVLLGFGAATLGSGDYELAKHLFLPSVGSTLLLALGTCCLLRLLALRHPASPGVSPRHSCP